MDLVALQAKRKDLATKMRAIMEVAETSALTDEQAKAFDDLEAEFKQIDAQIQRLEKMAAVQTRLSEVRPAASAGQLGADPVHPQGPEAKRGFESFGEFLSAVLEAKITHRSDQRLVFDSGMRAEQRLDLGSKGGFMVPKEFRPEMLKVDAAATPFLAACRRLPAGTVAPDATVSLPKLNQGENQQGGVTVARIGEGVARPSTDFDIGLVEYTPSTIGAHIPLTIDLIQNWTGAEGMAQQLLREALNAELEDEAIRGDGVKKFTGVLESGATYAVARTTAGTVKFEDVTNMAARKLQRGGGAFWLYNQLLLPALMQMKDGNNNLVWQPSIREGSPQSLWGLPCMPHEFASAVGSFGDLMLVQPNPYYIVKDGSGPFVDIGTINDDFTTGRVRVLIYERNDGGPWLDAPFKLKNGTEVSPFVALDVPG